MPSTDFETPDSPRYDFTFAWESSYGRVVKLIQRLGLESGVVVDLGCGVGSIADPLADLGYEYLGADIDTKALERISSRGFETRELDLRQINDLPGSIAALAKGRRVAAVLLLDVIEHLPDVRSFLAAIGDGLDLIGRPPLVVSVPNVTHSDIGAKLVFGRWDYTATGLLDSTHIQFFTSKRLKEEARAAGLLELDANDFKMQVSDQRFPPDHPALSRMSPVAEAMRMWREMADPYGDTVQFVRAFVRCDITLDIQTSGAAADASANPASFLTVVMRTQGKRSTHLREALTCLAAQTIDDFDVMLMVHSEDPDAVLSEVTSIVDEFGPGLSPRVSVIPVSGGRRARPLNVALSRLKSDYVAFLDDDDMVMADWVESFVDAAGGGAIVRSTAAVRQVSPPADIERTPYVVHSALEFRYSLDFDLVRHFWGNETPICTFAVPRSLLETFDLRFDEQLPVLEDWDFLMSCVAVAPVHDTRKVTSVYQMWRSGESSSSLHEVDLWQATHRVLQDRANLRPLMLPAGSVERLVKMSESLAEFEDLRLGLVEQVSLHQERAERMTAEADAANRELQRVRKAYVITISSRRWRILAPLARVAAALRR